MTFPVEAGLEVSKSLVPGFGFHAGAATIITDNIEIGIKSSFIKFKDLKSIYYPVSLTGRMYMNIDETFLPYLTIEAGHGFYEEPKTNLRGGFNSFLGLGTKFSQDAEFPLYATGGVSIFGITGPSTHSNMKRLSFRIGVEF